MATDIEKIDFVWKGKDRAGNKTGGQISAKSEIIARTTLRKNGIRVLRIKKNRNLYSRLEYKQLHLKILVCLPVNCQPC